MEMAVAIVDDTKMCEQKPEKPIQNTKPKYQREIERKGIVMRDKKFYQTKITMIMADTETTEYFIWLLTCS